MKQIILFFILSITLITSAGFSNAGVVSSRENHGSIGKKRIIIDALGRNVEIPVDINKVLVLGKGALRLYSYAGDLNKIVGVEAIEHDGGIGRPYTQIYEEYFKNLPSIDKTGEIYENVKNLNPDVIFIIGNNPDIFQVNINIPVIALSYGENGIFDEAVYNSLNIIGDALGTAEKANAAVEYIKESHKDLKKRTETVKVEDRASAYFSCVDFQNSGGIENTQGNLLLFDVLNINNVADQTNMKGNISVSKEQILTWNPKFIFVDLNGLSDVEKDINIDSEFYKELDAFSNKDVYGQLPYEVYGINIETAIVNMYFIGKTVYPDAFKDINPVLKAEEIYSNLLGYPFYERVV